MIQLAFALMLFLATPALAAGSRDAELSALVQQMSGETVQIAYYTPKAVRTSTPMKSGSVVQITCSKNGWTLFHLKFDSDSPRVVQIPPTFIISIAKTISGKKTQIIRNDIKLVVIISQKGGRILKKHTDLAWSRIVKGRGLFTYNAFEDGFTELMEGTDIPISQERMRKVRSICSR